MGTTLTGTTPQDTYDSLIKVTDNGPLSATAKFLSDGLGNDSVLALSTTAVGIGTDTPVSKANILATKTTALTTAADFLTLGLTIDDSTAFNNVGVGGGIVFRGKRNSGGVQTIYSAIDSSKEDAAADDFRGALRFYTNQNSTGVPLERMRITSAGKVGIGTSAPATTLHVSDAAATTATFNSTFGQLAISFANSGTTFAQIGSGVSVASTGGAADLGFGTAGQANASIVFATGASFVERFRITNNGVTFNGDTAAANALDDYEEGTFTPVPVGWTTNPTSLSGKYVKIGALVSIKFTFTGGVKATATSAYFTGLPFAGAEAGGGTVSSTGVDDLGIILLDNSDRIWLTQSVFTGFVAKGTGSYMLV